MGTIYVGIDPGLSGAVVALVPPWPAASNPGAVTFHDTPTAAVEVMSTVRGKRKKRTRNQYDETAMVRILEEYVARAAALGHELIVILEKSQPMPAWRPGMPPGQASHGTIAAFALGLGAGLWRGMLAALKLPYVLVSPVTWKAALLKDQPKTKEGAYLGAARLYPQVADRMRGPKGGLIDGRAEALLLAHYGKYALSRGVSGDAEAAE